MKVRIAILLLLVLTAFASIATAQKGAVDIAVEIEGRSVVILKRADITKLPRVEVKGKDHDGVESTFSGFELRSILAPAGAKFGKELRGPTIGQYLVIEAADGYRAVYSVTELDPDFTDKVVILADTVNGKPLSEKYGPWQIIASGEKKHARWVRQVTALRMRMAK